MNQMFFYQSPNVERADYVCGIQLIPNSPQLDNAPLVYFTDTEIASRRHVTKVEKIFSDVMNKFVPKYKGMFSADVIQNWAVERMQASKMEYHFRISSLGTNGAPTAMCTQTTPVQSYFESPQP